MTDASPGKRSGAGRTRRRPWLGLLILAVAVLAPNGGGLGGVGTAAQASQATTTTSGAAAAAAAAPDQVLASSEKGDLSGLTLAVNQLRRSDPNTVTLVFTIANQGSQAYSFDWTWGEVGVIEFGDAFTFNMSGVYLVEPAGMKKYLVLLDTDKRCVCSTGIFRSGGTISGLIPGKDATMWAKFPAPPASVTRLAVAVPHFPVLDGVPLS
jgi:hypothetical protein